MLIDYAAITHIGRVRKNNEDAYLVSALDGEEPLVNQLRPLAEGRQAGILLAVADGMGGAASGEIASREALASVALTLFGHWGRLSGPRSTEDELVRALNLAASEASSAVLRYADSERGSRGMGTTLTAAVVWNGHAYLAQVGDSRAYLFRGGRLVQLTEDQTLMQELIAAGTLTEAQARVHPQRSLITQALGGPTPIQAVLGKVALRRGDRLILCSDGLHGELPDSRIAASLALELPLADTLQALVNEALVQGGRDNITALALALDAPGLPEPRPGEAFRAVRLSDPRTSAERVPVLTRLIKLLRGNS